MEKKNYYTPKVKFHQLKTTAMIAESEIGGGGNGGQGDLSKSCSLSFDEDE